MSDAHIHAFVDRQLKLEREERLQKLVSAWPEKYEQVQEYQLINQRLQDGLSDVYDQAIPDAIISILKGNKVLGRASSAGIKAKKPARRKLQRNKNIHKELDDITEISSSIIKDFLPKRSASKKAVANNNNAAEATLDNNSAPKNVTEARPAEIVVEPEVSGVRELDVDLPRHSRITGFGEIFSSIFVQLTDLASDNMKLIASIFVGVVIGWTTHNAVNAFTDSSSPEVAQLAIDAHLFYSAESKHAVEVSAKNRKHLRRWIKSKLKSELEPVNLQKFGYELMGGRVLPVKGKLAGQYMYKSTNDGSKLTIYMSTYLQDSSSLDLNCENIDTSSEAPLSVCGWEKENIVFYVISNQSTIGLREISTRVKALMPKKKT